MTAAIALPRPSSDTLLSRSLAGLRRSPKAMVAGVVCILLLLTAVFGPWLAPQDPYDLMQINIIDAKLPPGSQSMSGGTYWLGTDGQGRDMLSAMIYGLRTSLAVGVVSGVAALCLGTSLGLIAAYFGGRVDALIMRLVDLMLGLPTILVALMLLALIGQGIGKVMFALVLVQWAMFARAVRGAALVEKGKEYVEAANSLGLSKPRILFGHLLPNCLPPIIVIGTLQVANAISAEATLSFLGIGLPITEPSLGLLIANGFQYMMSGKYWISVYPGVALLVTIVAINLVGDRLRDVLNPRNRK
jgi:peptide/nickel transport system permease protein